MRSEKEGTTMDFTLSVSQCRLVGDHRQKIVDLFHVYVKLPGSVGVSSSPVWVEITGEKENSIRAKNYMLSLCSDITVVERLPAELLDTLDLSDIEYQTQAALARIGRDELRIQGNTQMIIATATSLIDHKYQQYRQHKEKTLQETNRLTSRDPKVIGISEMGFQQETSTQEKRLHKEIVTDSVIPDSGHKRQNGMGTTIDVIVPPRQSLPVGNMPVEVKLHHGHEKTLDNIDVVVPPRNPTSQIFADCDHSQRTSRCSSGDGKETGLVPHGGSEGTMSDLEDVIEKSSKPAQEADKGSNPDGRITCIPTEKSTYNPRIDIDFPQKSDDREMMQKLGYSREQVEQIIQQLGPNADTNDILGALVTQSKISDKTLQTDLDSLKEAREPVKDLSDSIPPKDDVDNLRTIIIDGSNVAMSFGNKDVFACKGIEIVVEWFIKRGHREIVVFVPTWRKEAAKPDTPITDQYILDKLNKLKILVFTPSRRIGGRRVVCYDDRYIIKTAVNLDGIVVSNDNFRDLQHEQPEYKKIVEERLLMYSFVGDQFMPPDDPLGRHGPSLDNFLRKRPTAPDHPPQTCPYGKKCTYGNKCKYYHPERPSNQKSISETLKEQAESRKRAAVLASILEDHNLSDTEYGPPHSKYDGCRTEPLRRPEGIGTPQRDYSKTGPLPGYRNPNGMTPGRSRVMSESGINPNKDGSGSYQYSPHSSPHRVSGYREAYPPPPNVHMMNSGLGQYSTEPLLPPASQHHEQYHGTVPLMQGRSTAANGAVPRHSSLPPDSGGPYGELQAAMNKLSLGNSSSYQDPRPYPSQSRLVLHNGADIVRYSSSHSAPLPQPDQMPRSSQNPNNHPHPSHVPPQMHGFARNQPSSHPVNHATPYHPSGYPNSKSGYSSGGSRSSLPLVLPQGNHQTLYPALPPDLHSERAQSYPSGQSTGSPFVDGNHRSWGPSTSDQSLAVRRTFFYEKYRHVYPEDNIFRVFELYPSEGNESRLIEAIERLMMFSS